MPKKQLDPSTLEVIAEVICGSGDGGGGGSSYSSPGPYRTKTEIHSFFQRAGVQPQGQSSTRKWFVLESLHALNTDSNGQIIPASLEKILRRLADPKEYRGDASLTQTIIEHLNQVLRPEGLELTLTGVYSAVREVTAAAIPPKPKAPLRQPPPDFDGLCGDATLAAILKHRWGEAERCIDASAHLAAVIMMGSILEGVLLRKVESDLKTANQAACSPKDKSGKVRPIHEWSLAALIEVAHEVGWLQGDVKRFSHALRESRNIVHPYVHRITGDRPDSDTCQICWQVVRAAIADLFRVNQSKDKTNS